jgi:hypothetical protein
MGNLWLGLLHATVGVVAGFVSWVVGVLPVADLSGFSAVGSGLRQAWGWAFMVNAWLPVAEMLAVALVVLGIYVAIHGASTIRRVFSLFWPGAGS